MTVPNRYASQLALPAVPYIKGTISAAVMVGEINAIAIAVMPEKPRHSLRNDPLDSPMERSSKALVRRSWSGVWRAGINCLIGNYASEVPDRQLGQPVRQSRRKYTELAADVTRH